MRKNYRQNDFIRPALSSLSTFFALVCFDLLAIAVSIILSFYLRNSVLPLFLPNLFDAKLLENTLELLWWYPLVIIFCLAYEKTYYKRLPFWIEVESLVRAVTLAFFITIVFIYLAGLGDLVSRATVIMVWLFNLLLIPTMRYYGKQLLRGLGLWTRPIVLISNAEMAGMISNALKREKTMGYQVIGFIDIWQNENDGCNNNCSGQQVNCLGMLTEAELLISEHQIHDLIIALPGLPAADLVEITNRFQPLVDNILIVPDLFGITLYKIEAAYFFEEQVVFLQITNRLRSKLNRAVKRSFDIIIGAGFFFLALPLVTIIAMLIKIDSRGPVFYIQKRIGQGGRVFSLIKFRTMYQNSDQILSKHLAANQEAKQEWDEFKKLKSADPRVTAVGRLLRRYSLDELPQVINVLKAEMSLVGPRPYLPREKEEIGSYAGDILIAKPGLTGLWQVSGRSNLSFNSRLQIDDWYVKNWALWLDIMLFLKTPRVVIRSDGSY